MKILHVTDCFHGGVATAVEQYARLLPEHSHFLLSNNSRSSALPTPRSPGAFAADHELPSTPLAAISAVRDTVAHLRPDVVHAHSSFAGVYVRLATALDRVSLNHPPTAVVYTPHSFAFERADVNTTKRRAFRLLEKLLYPLTTVGAPCAQWEGVLMNRLGNNVPWKVPVIVVPNVLATDHYSPANSWAATIPPTVGVVSRVTPQRDPVFFASTVRLIREALPDTRFIWIGEEDGKDGSLTSVLEDAGVEVTGWLSGAELHRSIAELSVALHPARWDGFPMSILEIRRIGVPLLVRDIPALRECPETARFTTPEEAADMAVRILTSGQDPTDWTRMDSAHAAQTQHDNLASVYDLAVGRTSAQAVVP